MPEASYNPFDEAGGLMFAVYLPGGKDQFDPDRRLMWDDFTHAEPAERPLWVHMAVDGEHARQWLRDESGLMPIVVDTLLSDDTRPQALEIDDGLLVVLRGVNLNPGAHPDEMIAIRMWIEKHRIITIRLHRFKTIATMRDRAEEGTAPSTPGGFLAAVATGLTGNLIPSVDNLEEIIDRIEDSMLDDRADVDDPESRSLLATVRRQAIGYKRYVVPQRDTLMWLSINDSPLITQRDRVELRRAAEMVARVGEALEEIRDRAAVTQDEVRARREARTSQTLYVLTIVATIALPLGLVTGLLGINVGGLPLVESNWGFAIVCIIMVLIAIGEYVLIKWLRWL